LECDPKLQSAEKLLVRNRANDGVGNAPNNYDFGFITVATEGLPAAAANAQIGRLYVTYDIEFSLPRLQYEIEAYEECYFASWGVPKNVTDVHFLGGTGAATDCPTFSTPCGTWNQWIRKSNPPQPGGPEVLGPSEVTNFTSNLSVGQPGTDSDIVLFTPTNTGNNVDDYHEDSGKMLMWVCGTGPLVNDQQCHFNFSHAGSIRLEFQVGVCAQEPAPSGPLPAESSWWIPSYTVEGADHVDVVWGTDMGVGQIMAADSRYTQSQADGSNAIIPVAPNIENENGNCTVFVTIKFKPSAPHRKLSIYPHTPGTPNENTWWGIWANATQPTNGPFHNKATRFTVQFLK
jgi:hypothetical protein